MTAEIAIDQQTARVVASGLRFPETPAVDADGSLLVPEIEGAAIVRVRPADGSTQRVAEVGGGANGCAFGPDGAFYVSNSGGYGFAEADGLRFPVGSTPARIGGRVQRVDLGTGAVTDVFTECDGTSLEGLNDIVFDAAGSAYVADTIVGVIYHLDPASGAIRPVATGLAGPNGVGLSPEGDRLYVSESFSGRLRAWEVTGPGELAELPDLHQHPARDLHLYWDGLAVDGAGNICIADQPSSGVLVLAPDGTPRGRFTLPTPDPFITSLSFGSDPEPTAYVSSGGRGLVYAVPWPWPALRLNFQP